MRPFLGVLVLSILVVSAAIAGTETNNAAVWFLILLGWFQMKIPKLLSPQFLLNFNHTVPYIHTFLFSALPKRSVLRPRFVYPVGLGCSNGDGVFDGKKKEFL